MGKLEVSTTPLGSQASSVVVKCEDARDAVLVYVVERPSQVSSTIKMVGHNGNTAARPSKVA